MKTTTKEEIAEISERIMKILKKDGTEIAQNLYQVHVEDLRKSLLDTPIACSGKIIDDKDINVTIDYMVNESNQANALTLKWWLLFNSSK